MSGNTFGKLFRLTSFGESHGPAIGGVVDGCPAGLDVSIAAIQSELDRRRPGQSAYTTQRREVDQVHILSGIYEGKTTGAPIGFMIHNLDAKEKDYAALKGVFRPGHGDYVYFKKYGLRDHRGGGRASARETAVRVVGGALAKQCLAQYFKSQGGIQIRAYLAQMGDIVMDPAYFSWESVEQNAFFCPDENTVPRLEALITQLRREGDSIGARVNIEVHNLPVGLGEPVFDKLDADLAKALMSINAVKGVEIGEGFGVVQQRGCAHRDEMGPAGFLSNHAGGILAGISSGQSLMLSIALKPPASIRVPAQSMNESGEAVTVVTEGRHDPCVGIRAVPVAEAMVALVLIDHYLQHVGQLSFAREA